MPADRGALPEAPTPLSEGGAGQGQAGIVTAVSGHESSGTASAALPGVLADVPVAVLVVDQGAGVVTYANTAAVEMAGNVRLPVDVDTWGDCRPLHRPRRPAAGDDVALIAVRFR